MMSISSISKFLAFWAVLLVYCVDILSQEESTFLSNTRQLIYEGKRSGEGYFSKDGQKLIFQAEREAENPFYQMYILDFRTGDISRVSPGTGKVTCGYFNWSNMDEVLFASSHHDPEALAKQKAEIEFRESGKKRRYSWDYEPSMDIFIFDQNGTEKRNLTNTAGYDAEGSFSPDGKYIAFASNRQAFTQDVTKEQQDRLEYDPAFFNEIYIMEADGSNVRRLTNTDGYDGGPFFSPDGKKIVWRRFNEKGDIADIYAMDLDGNNKKQLTDFSCMSWAPYYHPSQQYIIFASNKHGFSNFELFLVDANGEKEPVRVTYTDGFDGLPVFSPDGEKLVWTSNRTSEGNAQLFIADWDHAAALQSIGEAPDRAGSDLFSGKIDKAELKEKVTYLASDALEGRMTGTEGARLAADYAIKCFSDHMLQPLVDESFRIPFSFSASSKVDPEKTYFILDGERLELNVDYAPLAGSESDEVAGDVAFAGYGIKIPGDGGYNSYSGLDVKDKVVVIFEDYAQPQDEALEHAFKRYGPLQYRSLVAREAGAKALVVIGDFDDPHERRMSGNSGIITVGLDPHRASAFFTACDKNLIELSQSLSEFNPHNSTSFELDKKFEIKVTTEKEEKVGHNVVALLPGNKSGDFIVLGAHYDHLGLGHTGSLLAENNFDEIHNGADDNASGTAAILEMAEYFSSLKRKDPGVVLPNLVFCLWSGEELGLIGSSAFCQKLPVDKDKVLAYFNYDMIGRMKDNRLILQGLGSGDRWKSIIEKKNILHGFNLVLQEDPYLPTDATSFYKTGIPVISFFTGLHEDYHRPSDDAHTVNYPDLERITKFSCDLVLAVNESELSYQKVEMSESQRSTRGFSVYLGTIPDYAAEVKGVKLSGVRPGAPADEAGLKTGDIIIELAGKEILNIYDYTYILGELEAGKKEKIVVTRDGKEVILEITPGAK